VNCTKRQLRTSVMSVLSAREIYRFARLAGFTPDQSVTMTAIALAESGGDPDAHNDVDENSQGLWQVNLDAHSSWAGGMDLFDPAVNAQAAFRISNGGRDISDWTVAHIPGGGGPPPYAAFQFEALAAARASGDADAVGVWTGTEGYGHPLPAGQAGESGALQTFLDSALAQTGDEYVFGGPTTIGDPDPEAFDCSELVRWAAHQAGVDVPDGALWQYLHLEEQGGTISVEQAMNTPGALLFSFPEQPTADTPPNPAHVAISLGDGRTIEARGSDYGVGSWPAEGRFQYAAVIPGLTGGSGGAGPLALGPAAVDTDLDGLSDALESQLGLSPTSVDTDADGMSDSYEPLVLGTDPGTADTDGDRISDGMELLTRTDPRNPDSDLDGRLDGATSAPDTDGDGVTDPLELLLRTDPFTADSDGDRFTDGAEYQTRLNPADPAINPLAPGVPPTGGSGSRPPTPTPALAGDPDSFDVDLDLPTG
jgi:cell wall-associated NlpC family hydrolase